MASPRAAPLILYCLDFDGVLVDSAAETGTSGYKAAKILWPDADWIQTLEKDSAKKQTAIDRFVQVRPCLETGWEASLILKLLGDPTAGCPTNEDIMEEFHSKLKPNLLEQETLTKEICNDALKKARNDWIAESNGQNWLDAHGFFGGAVQAVAKLLQEQGNENVYIITTKAKEYAIRLLEQQGLYGESSLIKESNVYGLGSGSKADILKQLLDSRKADIAVMVEDNLATLHKIMSSDAQNQVLPALASWGYTTPQQEESAKADGYVVLSREDPSSIAKVLDASSVDPLFQLFQQNRKLQAIRA